MKSTYLKKKRSTTKLSITCSWNSISFNSVLTLKTSPLQVVFFPEAGPQRARLGHPTSHQVWVKFIIYHQVWLHQTSTYAIMKWLREGKGPGVNGFKSLIIHPPWRTGLIDTSRTFHSLKLGMRKFISRIFLRINSRNPNGRTIWIRQLRCRRDKRSRARQTQRATVFTGKPTRPLPIRGGLRREDGRHENMHIMHALTDLTNGRTGRRIKQRRWGEEDVRMCKWSKFVVCVSSR